MVVSASVMDIFADAQQLYQAAVAQLEAGDIRDAAEKAWCATLRATDALIMARIGTEPEKSPFTSRELDTLAESDPGVKSLVGRYYSRQSQLHGKCFYLGLCEPINTTERRIRETQGYIDDAKTLAGSSPDP